MATFTGHDGAIKVSGDGLSSEKIGNLRSFTVEQSQDAIETTSMEATGGYRTYKPGLSTWSVSGDMYFDLTDSAQAKMDDLVSFTGDEAFGSIECYPSGTATTTGNTKLNGNFIFTSFSVTSSVDGIVEASFSGQGSAALTVAQTA